MEFLWLIFIRRRKKKRDLKFFLGFWTHFFFSLPKFGFQIVFKLLNRRLNYEHLKLQSSSFNAKFSSKATKNISNVTPPPSYATLFNRNKIFTTDDYIKSFDVNSGTKRVINGRNYMVFRNNDGEQRLVPMMRTPSAALFQYAYTK